MQLSTSDNICLERLIKNLIFPFPSSLEELRIINDLKMFYWINSNFVNIFFPAETSLGSRGGGGGGGLGTRRSHDCKFMPLSASVNAYKYPRSGMVFLFQWYVHHLSTFSKLGWYLISVILLAFCSCYLLA